MTPVPLVIVEGFLGGAGSFLWGNFHGHCDPTGYVDAKQAGRQIIFVSIGPVSSLHDRACELYYALKGGTVDYGAEHSYANGHGRYGRHHSQGLYPDWSFEKPLHFFGHSMGGPTVTKLQRLLEIGFFGRTETPDMVLSLTAVSAPFRGTQAVYTLGECTDSAPRVRPFSVGSLLTKGVHIASYLSPHMPSFLDMHAEARFLSYTSTTFRELVASLRQSKWGESRDAAPFDMTFEAADMREAEDEGPPFSGTYYRSYTAYMTRTSSVPYDYQGPSLRYAILNPPLFGLSSLMETFDFSTIKPSPSIISSSGSYQFRRSLWRNRGQKPLRSNDGVVPVFSQWHPYDCSETTCRHWSQPLQEARIFDSLPGPTPGVWEVFEVPEATHVSLVPFWFASERQCAFWRSVGQWLRAVDKEVEVRSR